MSDPMFDAALMPCADERDVTNAARRCCHAMSSVMAHFVLKCNKTNFAFMSLLLSHTYVYTYTHMYTGKTLCFYRGPPTCLSAVTATGDSDLYLHNAQPKFTVQSFRDLALLFRSAKLAQLSQNSSFLLEL